MTELTSLLEKQIELLNHFLELEKSKTDVLITADIVQLDEIVKKEQSYIMQSANLESRRNSFMASVGCPDMPAREFLEINKEHQNYPQLLELFQTLSDALTEMDKVNDVNQRLIKSRIDILHLLMNEGAKNGTLYNEAAEKQKL